MAEDAAEPKGRTARDPSGTIKRIIAAAREEFGANGFDGTRMEHIARRAKVSKQLVYLYFNSKDELYSELLKVISRETYEGLLKIDFGALEPEVGVRTYIEAVYDRFQNDPVIAVVTLDQSLHDGAQIRLAPDARRMREQVWERLNAVIDRARGTGVIGDTIDIADLEFLTVIIVSGCVSSRGMFRRYLGSQAFQEESPAFWRDYAVRTILRALRG
jgi:AcrR family transcriptional regulator